ncbi:MAG TPA: beta-ketoacyl-ACP synthase III [Propionibacteriaceae bacterium]|nr:beta-ketoacyl-ACP synthase III [Propionibacteriaceae bacterium]
MTTLNTRPGHRYARLMSVGGYRGSRVVDNAEMCTMIDSSDEWIRQRTGIVERRWATEDETPLSMSVAAGRKAIKRAGLTPDQIGAVIVSTVSHFKQTPSLACEVAAELGCPEPAAFDISAACAGFSYGVGIAEGLIRSGSSDYVLVIGVEVLSRLTDFNDRGTAFLFSDGAGATVVGPSDVPAIGPTVWGSDPKATKVIEIEDWKQKAAAGETPYIHMDGRTVFLWATTFIADKTKEALALAGLEPHELDVFIPHQANNRITDSMLRHLKLPESVVVSRDIVHMGNSSAASVPLAMEALLESGEATSGQNALIIGFGAGLVFAGQVVTLP